jgi:hypothetical protein
VFIQRPMEGFIPFGLGAGGSHLGEVVPPGGTRIDATSVMAHMCLLECTSEGR